MMIGQNTIFFHLGVQCVLFSYIYVCVFNAGDVALGLINQLVLHRCIKKLATKFKDTVRLYYHNICIQYTLHYVRNHTQSAKKYSH